MAEDLSENDKKTPTYFYKDVYLKQHSNHFQLFIMFPS